MSLPIKLTSIALLLMLPGMARPLSAFGQTGADSVALAAQADYFGEHKADYSIWRPSNGFWYIIDGGNDSLTRQWGESTDLPLRGDYDGDGKTDIAVFRPSNGYWYVIQSSNGQVVSRQWGESGDIAVDSISTSSSSGGVPTVTVPNVVGDTQSAATAAISGAGLTVGIITMQFSNTVASGNVISESPGAATSVASGSAVALIISSGSSSAGGYTVGGTVNGGLPFNQISALVLGNGTATASPTEICPGGFSLCSYTFAFPRLPTGTEYTVSVTTQPAETTCAVTQGATGTIGTADISNVSVTCGAGTWSSLSPMPIPRGDVAVAVVNNILYVIGGVSSTPTGSCYNNVDAYDPSTNQWTTKAPLPFAGSAMSAVAINNLIYVFGGENCGAGTASANVYIYHPATDSWTQASTMMPSGGLTFMGAATDGTNAYLVGGANSGSLTMSSNIQIYNPTTNSWSIGAAFPETWGPGVVWDGTAASSDLVIFGGYCCVGGGLTEPDNPLTVYLYFPSSETIFSEPNTTLAIQVPAIDIDGGNILIMQQHLLASSSAIPTLYCYACTGVLGSSTLAIPTVARSDFAGAFINGIFYAVGGYLWNGSSYNMATGALEAFHP